MTAISANIPEGIVNVPHTPERFDLACTDGILAVLRDAGVDADVDLSSIGYVVLYIFGWANNRVDIRYTLNSDPATVLTVSFNKDEMLGARSAFDLAMKNGFNAMVRRKLGTRAFVVQDFIIQREGEWPRGWNANNALSLRIGAVNKTY